MAAGSSGGAVRRGTVPGAGTSGLEDRTGREDFLEKLPSGWGIVGLVSRPIKERLGGQTSTP